MIIVYILAFSCSIGVLEYFLARKQSKYVLSLKVGDKIYMGGYNGEIIEKINHNEFVIKQTVHGMALSKPYKNERFKKSNA